MNECLESRNCDVEHELTKTGTTERLAPIAVTLLTGGGDRDYLFGLTMELISRGFAIDLIGSDQLDGPEFRNKPGLTFLNLRGDQGSKAPLLTKVSRILKYYWRLMCYARTAKPRIFHILWNNKFEAFDRTLLMLYYKFLGKKIVFTAHNVNAGRRDSRDSLLNRITLRIQYRLSDQIFVHTEKMRTELMEEFLVPETRVTVIPYGINNAVRITGLSTTEAKRQLGIHEDQRSMLFFGNIRPYKGLEYLVAAFQDVAHRGADYRLIVAGKPQNGTGYWSTIRESVQEDVHQGRVLIKADFIPDEEAEVYFKAADVLVLPYKHIYQSGVLFLGYSFGLPVLAADVGSLKEDIIEGETGFLFQPENPTDLAKAIERYFASDLFANLKTRRDKIQAFAIRRHSWGVVGQLTMQVYSDLLCPSAPREVVNGAS